MIQKALTASDYSDEFNKSWIFDLCAHELNTKESKTNPRYVVNASKTGYRHICSIKVDSRLNVHADKRLKVFHYREANALVAYGPSTHEIMIIAFPVGAAPEYTAPH